MPKSLGGFVLAVLLTIVSMFAIGLWLSAWAHSGGVATGVGQLILYPLLFFAGLWVPRAQMTPFLRDIGAGRPSAPRSRHFRLPVSGFPSAKSLLVLVAYAAVFGYLAVRYFRWSSWHVARLCHSHGHTGPG